MMALGDRNTISFAELGLKKLPAKAKLPSGWATAKVGNEDVLTKADYSKGDEMIYKENIYRKGKARSSQWVCVGKVNEQAKL
jgi:hypothetical protein